MKIMIYVITMILLAAATQAQEVRIPDANLRAALTKALKLKPNAPITQEALFSLEKFDAPGHDIADLTGLRFAPHLEEVNLSQNPRLTHIAPLARGNLRKLSLNDTGVSDISPLETVWTLDTDELETTDSLQQSDSGSFALNPVDGQNRD